MLDAKTDLSDGFQDLTIFSTFLNLHYGNMLDEVILQFGKPVDLEPLSSDSLLANYLDGGLNIYFSQEDQSISSIHVRSSALEDLRAMGIKDNKLKFIGCHRDEIIKVFGHPTEQQKVMISDKVYFYQYPIIEGKKSLAVRFFFEDDFCNRMGVYW